MGGLSCTGVPASRINPGMDPASALHPASADAPGRQVLAQGLGVRGLILALAWHLGRELAGRSLSLKKAFILLPKKYPKPRCCCGWPVILPGAGTKWKSTVCLGAQRSCMGSSAPARWSAAARKAPGSPGSAPPRLGPRLGSSVSACPALPLLQLWLFTEVGKGTQVAGGIFHDWLCVSIP